MSTNADIIDLLAGIEPDSPLARLRDGRAQARDNAQRSFEVLFEPGEPGDFPLAERYAVAYVTARLHGVSTAADLYADLLGDEAPELVDGIAAVAEAVITTGPYGDYREPDLAAESVAGPSWRPDADTIAAVGARLAAALGHTHLLVYRPREATAGDLEALVAAGWSADAIVRLSQLVAFLAFQLRTVAGLQALRATPATVPTPPTTEGASR